MGDGCVTVSDALMYSLNKYLRPEDFPVFLD